MLPTGADHHAWKGGRKFHDGYVLVLAKDHPQANADGYIREHILVAEKALGRLLPERAVVHHVDEAKANNAGTNLVLCQDQGYHNLLHRRLRALRACGNPSAVLCDCCHGYEDQADMWIDKNGNGRHRKCNREKEQRRRIALKAEAS